MPKTLTGAALKANRRRVLIDTARADMTTGHPDHIVALLVQAEKARPTRNPAPLRPEVRDAAAQLALHDLLTAIEDEFHRDVMVPR
jgi:anti-sigma factor ChrR (cupin superfamily)